MGTTVTYQEEYIPGKSDPLLLLQQLIDAGFLSDYLLYQNQSEVRIAANTLASVAVSSEKVSIRYQGHTQTQFVDRPLQQVEQGLNSLPIENWTAYGYISFDFAGFYYSYSKVIQQPLLYFFVPKTEIYIRQTEIFIRTVESFSEIKDILSQGSPKGEENIVKSQYNFSLDAQQYIERVNSLKTAIQQGKLQKAILCRSIKLKQELDIFNTYKLGIQQNHNHRSYCLKLGDVQAVGFSPEGLLEIYPHHQVLINPLAGTRPRSQNQIEDARLRQELFTTAKEVKEHALSIWHIQQEMRSICQPETIKIQDFMQVKQYRYVQHLSSQVIGQLQPQKTPWDAIKALFPAVTVSGIEKAAAIAAIDQLEDEARGLYAGGLGWINSQGQADLAIPIRSAYQYLDQVYLNAGAGIMAESIAEQEADECLSKMNTMLNNLVLKN
ncbi:MAG: salicylate synthase [Microcoleaceae cyanobacterium]